MLLKVALREIRIIANYPKYTSYVISTFYSGAVLYPDYVSVALDIAHHVWTQYDISKLSDKCIPTEIPSHIDWIIENNRSVVIVVILPISEPPNHKSIQENDYQEEGLPDVHVRLPFVKVIVTHIEFGGHWPSSVLRNSPQSVSNLTVCL